MMSPEAGKLWFRVAVFITCIAAALLPFQKADSPEFVITVLSLVIGMLFIVVLAVMARRSR
jgi:hypothetical protein